MQALIELYNELINMYAYHAEMRGALYAWEEKLVQMHNGSPTQKMFFGRDDPNKSDAAHQYSKTFIELIHASSKNGAHANTLSRSVVALTYSIWEDKYRARIAHECEKEKNEIESDIFHDLNKYRQAILHAGGRLVGTPKVLKFCKQGEEVLLSGENIHEMFAALVDELNRIAREHFDHDPGFTLDKPMRTAD